VLVMEVAQVGAVFKLGLQVRVYKFGCSSRGVQVGCCEFLVSIFRWSKPLHHVKVNLLGEEFLGGSCKTTLKITGPLDSVHPGAGATPTTIVMGGRKE
jgi:hypothetical protein